MVKTRVSIPKPVRDQVLKEYSHRCSRCGGDSPQLHHIDENPSHNDPLNLIPLCPNCHHNWFHNPLSGIESDRLQFFRIYKHPLILKPQFSPLFKRLQFLGDVDKTDADNLRASAGELISFVKAHEMGEFYSGKIAGLLRYPEYTASVSIGMDGRVPQWYVNGKNNERPQYLAQLKNAKERVYELVVEMLAYQQWS